MPKLDFTNVLSSAVGEKDGIDEVEWQASAPDAERAVTALQAARHAGSLGFADLPGNAEAVDRVLEFARSRTYRHIVILGIGGSALGPAALEAALAPQCPDRRLCVLDNIDPDFIHDALATLDPRETMVCVIAKSGVTAETMASFVIVRGWLMDALGERETRERFVAVTDPEKGDLLALAKQEGFPVFHIPPNVGGRFSVLTPVGTLPAALLGLDVPALMRGASRAVDQAQLPMKRNPALMAASIQHYLDTRRGKHIQVLFPYSQALWKFAFWFKQLWGESLGKRLDRSGRHVAVGQTPTAALGVTDQHSQLQLFVEGPNDKSFVFFDVQRFGQELPLNHPFSAFDSLAYLNGKTVGELFRAEKRATEIALTEAGRPNMTLTVDEVSAETLGELIMFSQYQTAFAGELYDINAFDQPGVEYGKKLTFAMMNRPGYEAFREKVESIERRGRREI